MKYTTETKLYIKNNKNIIEYFNEVKKQYSYILRTSWIAKNKFCDKMKLNIHTGASFVIARRGMNIKDVV